MHLELEVKDFKKAHLFDGEVPCASHVIAHANPLFRSFMSMIQMFDVYLILVVQSMEESLALALPTLELSSRKLDCLPRVLE